MERHLLFVIILTTMIFVSAAGLAAIGEGRLDVYLSLFTIEYLAVREILRIRIRGFSFAGLDPLTVGLCVIFGFIVLKKIIEILR